MYLSARARLILEQLLIAHQPVFMVELARDFSVSERTIRRDLKEVEAVLSTYQLKLKKDTGILTLEGANVDKQRFRWQLLDLSYNEYSPEERQQTILKMLLKEAEGVKLVGLATDLRVTISTISGDLTKLEERLPENVQIERKRGSGVCLIANERQKRTLMSEIFGQQFPNYQLLKLFQEQSHDALVTEWIEGRLLDLVSKELVLKVEKCLRNWRIKSEYEVNDEAYVNLVIHLSISVERMIAGSFIQMNAKSEEMIYYLEFETAKNLLAEILEMEPEVVPEGEAAYVASHLRGIKTRENYLGPLEDEELRLMSLTKMLIEKVEIELNRELPKGLLMNGLVAHLRPTLRRLEQGMKIHNPLIDSIKSDYPELFLIVRRAFDQVYQEEVPDEEIGYLVLHFGAILLQLENTNHFSGLVVCASGIGTSRMLVTRLRQRIPQLKKLETVSMFELAKRRSEKEYDVIISTIDLGQTDFHYFLVSPMLNERELSQIAVFLKSLHNESHKKITYEKQTEQITLLQATESLERQQQMTETIIAILKNFTYIHLQKKQGAMEDTVRAICTQLLEKEPRLDVEALIHTFILNNNRQSFTVPGTRIGILHARNASIKEPIFQLFSLKQSIMLNGRESDYSSIDRIVLLLAPEKCSSEGLEVISYISTLFVDNKTVDELLDYGTNEEITNYFVQKLLHYLEMRRN